MDKRLVSHCLSYLQALDSPMAHEVTSLIKAEDWDGVANLAISPRDYSSPLLYWLDANAVALLKKSDFLPGNSEKRKAAAIAKWRQGEQACFKTNRRLADLMCYITGEKHLVNVDPDPRIVAIVRTIRKIIRGWIGSGPPEIDAGRFGPGNVFETTGDPAVPDKMRSATLTPDAIWYVVPLAGTLWGAALAKSGKTVKVVPGNRFTTAPKTAATDRAIAVEPSVNIYYQLGLGSELRRRVAHATGWDLNRAQEVHRRVAETSSVTREFATLDLSNASDTLAHNLVRLLLPRRWYEALDMLRSKKTLLEDHWYRLEKFSSMGNGYTFELETLIFAAIAVAMSAPGSQLGKDVYVFGDDIIVREDAVPNTVAALGYFGFTLNDQKSFWGETSFRESCGADYFSGHAVRPFYLKREPNDPIRSIAFANGVNRVLQNPLSSGAMGLRTAWFRIVDHIPHPYRCFGPQALGDQCIHDRQESWTIKVRNSIRYVRTVQALPVRFGLSPFSRNIQLATAVYGAATGSKDGAWYTRRHAVEGFRTRWVAYS